MERIAARLLAMMALAAVIAAGFYQLAVIVDAAGILHGSGEPVTGEMVALFLAVSGSCSVMCVIGGEGEGPHD